MDEIFKKVLKIKSNRNLLSYVRKHLKTHK